VLEVKASYPEAVFSSPVVLLIRDPEPTPRFPSPLSYNLAPLEKLTNVVLFIVLMSEVFVEMLVTLVAISVSFEVMLSAFVEMLVTLVAISVSFEVMLSAFVEMLVTYLYRLKLWPLY